MTSLTVRLKDAINEGTESELREKLRGAKDADITFDASKVLRVNSIGMRDFTRLAQEAARNNRLTFKACSPIFVDFLILVPVAAKTARIESVVLAFLCDDCDERATQESAASSLTSAAAVKAPTCKKCRKPMTSEADLDVLAALIRDSGAR